MGLRWRVQRASLPGRPGRRSSLLRRMWTDSCKCPAGCYQLGRVWGEQVPRADANMMALGVLAGQSSAPWGRGVSTWRAPHCFLSRSGHTCPAGDSWPSNRRGIVIPSATSCLPGCSHPGARQAGLAARTAIVSLRPEQLLTYFFYVFETPSDCFKLYFKNGHHY